MRYAILGTAQAIRDDGSTVAVGGARLRALLTALALRPGRAVPVALLVAEVWDADPPADALAALQALVGRLRRVLGHAAVRSAEGGYLLEAEREDVDLYRFERLVRAAAAATEPARAAALYDEGLALWRGPALASLPDPAAESARWEAVRMDARRGRLGAALALGEAERALPELSELCARQPLDEPLQVLRIRALRAVGRPAEALAAYETVRRDLATRLGTDPGPALRALHTELLSPPTPPGPGTPTPVGPAAPAPAPGVPEGAAGRLSADPAPGVGAPGTWPAAPEAPAPGAGPAAQAGPGPQGAAPAPAGRAAVAPVGAGPEDAGGRYPADVAGSRAAGPWRAAPAAPAPGVPEGAAGRLSADPAPGVAAPGTRPATQAPAPAPAGRAAVAPVGNLRARLTTFVGREEDIRVIGDDLARARLVTLLGPGGAGKTRLSQEAAETHAHATGDGWPDGVWLVELAPVDDPEDVAEAALAALGARETKLRGAAAEELRALTERAGDNPLDRLAEHCSRRRILLLLDNCEHVIGAAAELAERLLTHCPGVQILATSREPLGVPGEFLRPVEPLPDPVALRLLGDRGAAARPGFSVAADPAAAAEICRRLDGLPLAIELAAARLRLLTPRQIADRLDDRFRLLTGGARTVLPRQQTLRAVVDWSWDLLDEPERAVLRRLSVFAGGCDLDAAEAVCGAGGLDVADAMAALVDKSLVVAAPGPAGDMRYRLLETVGEYAAERLAEAGADREDTGHRHLVHYRELARTAEPLLRGHGQRAAADRLATEHENLRTALRRAVATRDVGEVLCLVHSLGWYWHMHDLRAESRHWSEAAAELGPDPFTPPYVPAEPVYERLIDTPPPYSGEVLAEGWRALHLVRLAARDQTNTDWDTPEVRARVEGVLATYRPGLPQTCRAPASLWIYAVMIAGDAGLLKRVVDATVDTARELGYRWELGSALQLRANILANRADWAGDASRDADESLALFRELGDDWGCAEALSARAEAREKQGDYALSAQDYREAIEYAERLGAKAQVTVLRVRMAGCLVENGRIEEAERILREILATVQQFGNEAGPAARMFLTGILGRTGRIPEARAQVHVLREEFALGAFAVFDVLLLASTAWLDNLEGKHENALLLAREAAEAVRHPLALMVAPYLPALYLLTAAVALAGLGGPERAYEAARLIGAYRAHLPPEHFPVSTEREDAALAEERARAELGDTAYEAAYAEGGGLTMEEATALI
ncbi:BTAD domain-containing putative transcriptional regulator [Streptomyces sp. NBC_00091]|uniref:AfsR/SARP family transcriptional regulator n=1 Tax=Streptomyces sp. NBC_00091 TaxID=2975648 RepID=UPI00224F6A25|nr:BTAD domain-containing putative transcriptional regulator [Streptomyces sp. NBC_00091]MCX5378648.1 AAA family ATPase [Streptomyces sp. NBC_00091]